MNTTISGIYAKTRIYGKKEGVLVDGKNDFIKRYVRDKRVLHVGCTDYPITQERINAHKLLHGELSEYASYLMGIDLSEDGIGCMKKHGFENVHVMDAEKMDINEKFDVIVAGDVVEHLSNPGAFLKEAYRLLDPGGSLVITVPSAYALRHSLQYWLFGNEIVHKDHCYYFSPKTLAALCNRFGFLPTTARYISRKARILPLLRGFFWAFFYNIHLHFLMIFHKREEVESDAYYEI